MQEEKKHLKTYQPEIALKEISIKNFRGFTDFKVALDPKLNVVIGENGSGKTALLDSVAKVLSGVVQVSYEEATDIKKLFDISDIKYDSSIFSLHMNLFFGNKKIECHVHFDKKLYPKIKISGFDKQILSDIRKQSNLPLIAYYPTAYAPIDRIGFKGVGESGPQDISELYDDLLPEKHFDFDSFFSWYKWQGNIRSQLGENKTLDSVGEAICGILSDDKNRFEKLIVNWLYNPNGELFIQKNGMPLNTNQLSSGEKTLLVLAADLARRLAIANPHRENPLEGHGIVLIDEVDLHLHPGWQRRIIPQLQKTFPNCQLIVSTHSPLVLSGIRPENIVMLSDFNLVEKLPNTFGKDTNFIQYEAMGVKQRPEDIQAQIDKIYELMDEQENLEAAKKALRELSKDLGENDSEILKAYTHIHFMED